MMFLHNKYGLFYVDKEEQKYFYKSYSSLDAVYYAIEHDQDFLNLEKTKVIVIELEENYENYN